MTDVLQSDWGLSVQANCVRLFYAETKPLKKLSVNNHFQFGRLEIGDCLRKASNYQSPISWYSKVISIRVLSNYQTVNG